MTNDPRVTDKMLEAGECIWGQQPASMNGDEVSRALVACYLAMHAVRPVPQVGGDDPRIAVLANNSAPVPWAEGLAGARMALAAIDAVDPLRRPVSGDRVEAALGVWFAGRAWSTGDDASTLRGLMSRALAAADRGHVVVDWRKPEEWNRDVVPRRWMQIMIPAQKNDNTFKTYSHWSAWRLPGNIIAWSEMPAPPAWATERVPVDRVERQPFKFKNDDKHLQSGETGRPPSPPDNGTVFTREKDALLLFLADRMEQHGADPSHGWTRVERQQFKTLKDAALPPAATWPPSDCLRSNHGRRSSCELVCEMSACPHAGQRANGDG